MKAKTIVFSVLIATVSFLSQSYTKDDSNPPTGVIKSFIKAVFERPYMSPDDIAKKYMIFEKKESKELNRSEMLSYQLNKLRDEKKKYYDPKSLQILSFDQLPKDRQLEFMDRDNVYGVFMSGSFITYVFTKNDKIISFDYILKGNRGYYLEY